jgi:hypothetical protein
MLAVGDRVPDIAVWIGPRERVSLPELARDGTMLLLFYLFDWSST